MSRKTKITYMFKIWKTVVVRLISSERKVRFKNTLFHCKKEKAKLGKKAKKEFWVKNEKIFEKRKYKTF